MVSSTILGRRWAPARRLALIGVAAIAIAVAATWFAWPRLTGGENGEYTVLATPPPGSVLPVPAFKHVWILVLENKGNEDVMGSPEARFLNELEAAYASAGAFQGIAHPSQPNYIAMVSGSAREVRSNQPTDVTAPTLFDQLETAGLDWRVYAENYPGDCYTGRKASGGRDGDGTYVRRHNPAISFTAIQADPARCGRIQDLTAFDPDAADVEFIIPNLCHDAHDCPLGIADDWMRGFVPRIVDSAAFQEDGVLFITFDESSGSATNLIPLIAISPRAIPGFRSDVPHSHYSLLRTIQDAFGVPCLAESCSANTLGELFD